MRLDAVGFCGLDDSAVLEDVVAISTSCPWVEWGVLLNPARQGEPRYASPSTLERISALARGRQIRLAAHLCGQDCLKAVAGDAAHVARLRQQTGCQRMQINPTAANLSGNWEAGSAARGLRAVAAAMPETEFILQVNAETSSLFQALFQAPDSAELPRNLAVLFDPSCGLGVVPDARPPPIPGVHCGYAGGMKPENIAEQLGAVADAVGEQSESVWIDMESGVRSVLPDGRDIFDLSRVRRVVEVVQSGDYAC